MSWTPRRRRRYVRQLIGNAEKLGILRVEAYMWPVTQEIVDAEVVAALGMDLDEKGFIPLYRIVPEEEIGE